MLTEPNEARTQMGDKTQPKLALMIKINSEENVQTGQRYSLDTPRIEFKLFSLWVPLKGCVSPRMLPKLHTLYRMKQFLEYQKAYSTVDVNI